MHLCTNSRFVAAELGSPVHRALGAWQEAPDCTLLESVLTIPDSGAYAVLHVRGYVDQAMRAAHRKHSSAQGNPHGLSAQQIGAIILYTIEWRAAHGTSLYRALNNLLNSEGEARHALPCVLWARTKSRLFQYAGRLSVASKAEFENCECSPPA